VGEGPAAARSCQRQGRGLSLIAVAVSGRGLVDPAEAVFRADDESLLRGGAAFETVRSYGGVPFLLDRHLRRLDFSIAALALPPAEGLAELVELVTGAAPPDHVLRLYRTDQLLVATVAALPDGLEVVRAAGLALRSVDIGAPAPLLAGAKSTSYGEAFAARRLAERGGADEALLVAGGLVLEAATANIWWRRGEELYTPAVRAGVLPGVTRELVLELAEAREGAFPITELARADEAFLTSSIREVMPVVGLDGGLIGSGVPGPAAARLQAALRLRSAG
jgi:branched-chain amino acid aminotransferase